MNLAPLPNDKAKIAVVFLCFTLTGCGLVIASKVPAGTHAGLNLKIDIMRNLNMMQKAYQPNCDYKVTEIRQAGIEGTSILEEWTVLGCSKETTYAVKLIPQVGGRTVFTINKKQ